MTFQFLLVVGVSGVQGLRPGQGSAASCVFFFFSHFFRTFLQLLKVRGSPRISRAELGAHSSSSTLSAHQMAPHVNDPVTTWVDDNGDAWTLVPSSLGVWWLNLHTMHTSGSRRASASRGGASESDHRPSVLQFLDMFVCGPVGFGRLRRPWKNSTYFSREAGFWTIFQRALCVWQSLSWCSCVSLQLRLDEFHISWYSPWRTWTLFPRLPRIRQVVLFLRNAWPHSGYMFLSRLGAFGRFAHFFYVKGNSDPEVGSCPALLRFADWRSVHRRCFSCFPEPVALGNWTLLP